MRSIAQSGFAGRDRVTGFGLVEILVGVTIGLVALLIVYQALALSEGYRRSTMAGGDAQSAGMISSFVLASDLANGGHTISESADVLARCPNTLNFATTWRPIPVLITAGASARSCSKSAAVVTTGGGLTSGQVVFSVS